MFKKLFDQKIPFLVSALLIAIVFSGAEQAWAQETPSADQNASANSEGKSPAFTSPIFDDKLLLDGYSDAYKSEPKEVIIAMIQDDTLDDYKVAAAVRVFRDNHSQNLFLKEKRAMEKILIRRLNRTDFIFVEVEIMHTLCAMDRYKYFSSMVPALIQKMDHYNKTVNEIAYNGINSLIKSYPGRAREARIIFNNLRKNLFLSRRRLSDVKEPDTRLKQKLTLVRWAIKILGREELDRLPKEVISLL